MRMRGGVRPRGRASAKLGGAGRGTVTVGACVLVAGLASGCAMLDPQGRAVQQTSAGHESSPRRLGKRDTDPLERGMRQPERLPVRRSSAFR